MSVRELVAIRRPSGARSLIARDDYDPAKHTLWEVTTDAVQGREEERQEEVAPRKRGRPRKNG